MEKCLLSIDWDYFVYTKENGAYLENSRSLVDLWYKRFLLAKARGEDIQNAYRLSSELDTFWANIRKHFSFAEGVRAFLSDSHALSYDIARETGCTAVYLFDAHADLGYGGPAALQFEVNCSNWLGKLLQENHITEAHIFYSPYTLEKPEHFGFITGKYSIRFRTLSDFAEQTETVAVFAVHICRSGAWTPPWLDDRFYSFADGLGIPYETVNCPERAWNPARISFSEQVNFWMA